MNNADFVAEKITQTASIFLEAAIEDAFPLFGAFEERKWARGWNPKLVYPETETMEEGTTFTTNGQGNGEEQFLWRVSKYEKDKHLVQYLVSTPNRYWTITVKCHADAAKTTRVEITYAYFGLNELGNKLNRESLRKMYAQNLKDWEEELAYYLKTGGLKPLKLSAV